MQFTIKKRLAIVAMTVLAMLPATAEEPIPQELAASEVSEFLNLWRVTLEAQEREFEIFLNFVDIDGQLGGTLDSAQQPEPLAIQRISKNGDKLFIDSQFNFFGRITLDVEMDLYVENGELRGDLREKSGIFTSEVHGVVMTQQELDDVQGVRPAPTETRMFFDNDKLIRVQFPDLAHGEVDWETLQTVQDGEIFEYTMARASKMYTDFDLAFGDTIIEAENMAPGYPGVYSLWLKRAGDGWKLVFNSQPDIWGTRHLAEHDVAEVPLEFSTTDGEAQETFLAVLDGDDNTGTLRMTWGNLEWTATFDILKPIESDASEPIT